MEYMPELHYCCMCHEYLGDDDGDGICGECADKDFTQDEIDTANKTSRSSGAIGKNAIVPRFIRETSSKDERILDFGAGKDAKHTLSLRQDGFDVTAYEFGENIGQDHDPKALGKQYDTVMASNVLNVQKRRSMVSRTLMEISGCVKPEGRLVVNYPKSPRHCEGLGDKHIVEILLEFFAVVERVSKTSQLYEAKCPKI